MKKAIAIGIGGIAAVLFYRWANPPSAYDGLGLAPEYQQPMEKADRPDQKNFNSELAQGARTVCRQRLGIKEQVTTGMEVAKLGYGSDKATAFNRCIVDAMYPDPERERKNRR
jgi:hypothetical protein